MRKRARAEAWARSQLVAETLRGLPAVETVVRHRNQTVEDQILATHTAVDPHLPIGSTLEDGVKTLVVCNHCACQTDHLYHVAKDHGFRINARHRSVQLGKPHMSQARRLGQA